MYDEHGDFILRFVNKVLVLKPIGMFNTPVAERLMNELTLLLESNEEPHWGCLIIADEFELGSADTNPIFKDAEIFCQSFGLTHAVYVFSTEAQVHQAFNEITPHPEVSRFSTRFLAEGLAFLNKAGYKITLTDMAKADAAGD